MSKETTKAIKMFFRTLIIAVLPVLISGLQDGRPYKEVGVAVGIAALMAINTYVNASEAFDSKGILPLV